MKDSCNICGKRVLFPYVKLHFFIIFSGIASLLPFLQVFAKQLGINEFTYGTIYTVLPFLIFASRLAISWIADYTKSIKKIVYILLIISSLFCIAVNFIPSADHSIDGHILCNSSEITFSYSNASNPECYGNITVGKDYYCIMNCRTCSDVNSDCQSTSEWMIIQRENISVLGEFRVSSMSLGQSQCETMKNLDCQVTCAPEVHDCFDPNKDSNAGLLQIMPYTIAVVILGCATNVVATLTDAICFHTLGSRSELYGVQRMWGTVGWGIFSAAVGAVNTAVTGASFIENVVASFAVSSVLFLIDIPVVSKVQVGELKASEGIGKDLLIMLRKVEVLCFSLSTFMMGCFNGLLFNFLYWYLTELKGPEMLLGITNALNTLVGEIPFFYFSSNIISAIGHFNAVTVGCVAYGIRFVGTSFITDPWWTLPFSVFNGPALALFGATMASYANFIALPGTQATMQGYLGGMFEGLGMAGGSFFGSLMMKYYTGRSAFRVAGFIAFSYAVVNALFTVYITYARRRAASRENLLEEIEPTSKEK